MAERDPLWVNGALDPEEVRVGEGAAWTPTTNAVRARSGIRPASGNPGAVTATGTPDANVHVAPFQAVMQSTRATAAGAYIVSLDSIKDTNTLSTPAHASLARNDLIVAHQSDVFYGDADSQFRVRQIVGTPSGSPADPSLTGYPDAIPLARVRVNAAATSITAANITDLRPNTGFTVAVGGTLPIPDQTRRDALTGLYDGLTIYRQDRDWTEIYDGTAWRVQGVAIVSSTGDLAAITAPTVGQLAYNTGDGLLYRRAATADWRVRGLWTSTQVLATTTASVTFTIPTYLRKVDITWSARCDAGSVTALGLRINGDATGVYFGGAQSTIGGTFTPLGYSAATSGRCGVIAAAATGASKHGYGTINISGWGIAGASLNYTYTTGMFDTPSATWIETGHCIRFVTDTHTTLTLLPQAGNFIAGSRFTVTGNE